MKHIFDIDIATQYGIEEAVLLENIYFWIEKNRANEKHFHDGCYWTYNSMKAFAEIFPYLNERKIKYVLKKLEDSNLIKTGKYNKKGYDRTKWYTLTEKSFSLFGRKSPLTIRQNCQMTNTAGLEVENESNPHQHTLDKIVSASDKIVSASDKIVSPIPDVNSDINSDIYIGSEKKLETKETTDAQKKIKKATEKSRTNFLVSTEKLPTLDEVESYVKTHNMCLDTKEFYEYYSNSDWKDSQGKKVKNWKQKLLLWQKNNFGKTKSNKPVEQKRPDSKVCVVPTENSCERIKISKGLMLLQAAAISEKKCSTIEVLKLTEGELKSKFTRLELIKLGFN